MTWQSWLLRLLDLGMVAFLFYRILLLVRGTRASQMIIGLFALGGLSVVAQWAQLDTLNWLLSSLKTVWIIAFIILFQPELRRALAQVGQTGLFRRFVRSESFGVVGHIVKAVEELSERRIGAMMALERSTGLKNYRETGVRLNSSVSSDLLVSIFTVPGPLHDGAVIIDGDQIASARCILPLTGTRQAGSSLGTRHRAAIGLSEESDALVIVVSEETGRISVAGDGQLTRIKDAAELRSYLSGVLGGAADKRRDARLRHVLDRGSA